MSGNIFNGGTNILLNQGVQVLFDEDALLSIGRFTDQATDPANQASLTIAGTTDNPVLISGPQNNPSAWGGIQVSVGSFNASNLRITGGGDPAEVVTAGGSVVLNPGAIVELSDVSIENSRAWGITCTRTGPESFQSTGITFAANTLGNIDQECGF
jgi:hypothetical protein